MLIVEEIAVVGFVRIGSTRLEIFGACGRSSIRRGAILFATSPNENGIPSPIIAGLNIGAAGIDALVRPPIVHEISVRGFSMIANSAAGAFGGSGSEMTECG